MVVRFVEIADSENPKYPKGENIAKELEKVISEIEEKENVKLISPCFIEKKDVLIDPKEIPETTNLHKVERYQLFFR